MAKVPKRSSARIWWVVAGSVALVALVIGLSLGLNRTTTPTPVAVSPPSGDRKAMGPTTAPVTLIEYGDFL
jgi:hypothetical protein